MLINPKQPFIKQIQEDEYEYQAELYDAKVYFNDPQCGPYSHLMKVTKDNQELVMSLVGATPTHVTLPQENQIKYHNMFKGVDALYTLHPDHVKEDLYINSKDSKHTFVFRAQESLPATFTEEGEMLYEDVFSLPVPYAYDDTGQEVEVELSYEEGYYTYTALPNENAVYPIVLDPTVSFSSGNIFVYSNAGSAYQSYKTTYDIPFDTIGFKPTTFNVSVVAYASAYIYYYYFVDGALQTSSYTKLTTGSSIITIPTNINVTGIRFSSSSQYGNSASYGYLNINSINTNDVILTYPVNITSNTVSIKLPEITEIEKIISLQGFYGINYSTNTPLTVQANTFTNIMFKYNIMPSGYRDLIIIPKVRPQQDHALVCLTENIIDVTQESTVVSFTETISALDSSDVTVNQLVKAQELNDLLVREQIQVKEVKDLAALEKVFIEASDDLGVLETTYGKDNSVITLTEKTSHSDSKLLDCYVTVAAQNNTTLLVSETIYKEVSSLLNLTESIQDGSGTVLPILESIQAASNDLLEVKEYIITESINSLGIKEYIALSDTESFTLTEKILASRDAYINIKENLKDIGINSVYISEWVKPISLELLEIVLAEQNKPVRLISFSRPIKQFKKGTI